MNISQTNNVNENRSGLFRIPYCIHTHHHQMFIIFWNGTMAKEHIYGKKVQRSKEETTTCIWLLTLGGMGT